MDEQRSEPSGEPLFFLRYGISRTGNPDAPIVIEPSAELCRGGTLRPTVLAAAVDVVGVLFARQIAGSDPVFTTDLSLRAPARPAPKRIVARGELLRAGRGTIASEVVLEADGASFAYGQASFRRVASTERSQTPKELPRHVLPERLERVPLERPLAREAGIVLADAARGRVELPLRQALLSPQGVMQGGLVALVVEEAALALAESGGAGPHVVTELDVRYLASGREGPIVSSAHWVTDRESAMLRVALRDAGNGDRLTSVALARVAPASAHAEGARDRQKR